MTTAFYSDADIDVGKALLPEEQNRLESLLPKQAWFDQFDGLAIDFNEAFSLFAVSDCDGIFLANRGENVGKCGNIKSGSQAYAARRWEMFASIPCGQRPAQT